MKIQRSEYAVLTGVLGFFLALAVTVDYHRIVNYLFSDESVYYMMAQSLAYDQDLEYAHRDLVRVYKEGWHAGPQGVFLTRLADVTLTDQSFRQLRDKQVPPEILTALAPFKNQPPLPQEKFLQQLAAHLERAPLAQYKTVILQTAQISNAKIYYSKSLAYALVLAPFIGVFGLQGFLILNVLLLFGMLVMGWLYLRQFTPTPLALGVTLLFFLLSASLLYTFWLTPETFNMFCIMLGLFLWLYQRERRTPSAGETAVVYPGRRLSRVRRWLIWLVTTPAGRLYLAPLPIAVAGASKLPNILFMFPIAAELLFVGGRQFLEDVRFPPLRSDRKARPTRLRVFWENLHPCLIVIAGFLVMFGLFYLLQYAFTGHFNQYAGDRKTFYWRFPFDAGSDVWERGIRLSNDDYFEESFYFQPKVLLLNLYYYVFGRFTGILPYFGGALLALYYLAARYFAKDDEQPTRRAELWRRGLLLLTIGGSILAYVIMAPTNYQGGGGAFGNRFFLNIYPAFFFLITALSGLTPLLVTWIISALFLAQALLNPFQTSSYPAAHAFRWPFRWLPVEYTLVETLPTNVNQHLRQTFGDAAPPFQLYFFDEYAANIGPRGFWVKGHKTVELALRTAPEPTSAVVTLMNGPILNQVTVSVAKTTQTVTFTAPHQIKRLVFPLEHGVPYFHGVVYPVSIHAKKGYVPKFTAGSGLNGTYFVGCWASISLDPLELGRAYLDQQQPAAAVAVLEKFAAAAPEKIETRYELGRAYAADGQLEAAAKEFKAAKRLFPEFKQTEQRKCQVLGKACLKDLLPPETEAARHGLAKFLTPLTRHYEAENLPRTTGNVVTRADASHGQAVVYNPVQNLPGFPVYGQNAPYPAGQYQVKFRVQLQPRADIQTPASGAAMYLEVFDRQIGLLAQQRFGLEADDTMSVAFKEYTLDFDLAAPSEFEFRVLTTGIAQVTIDAIDVYPRLPIDILTALARIALLQGEAETALTYANQAHEAAAWNPEVQELRVQALIATGETRAARKILEVTPGLQAARSGIASALLEQPPQADDPELQAVLDGLAARFHPAVALNAVFGERLKLLGYTISQPQVKKGEIFTLDFFWQAVQPMDVDYTIFVHFTKQGALGAADLGDKLKRTFKIAQHQRFQHDHKPLDGAYSTRVWRPFERIRETYPLAIPPDMQPGVYEIWVGVWDPLTKERLRCNGAEKIQLGELEIHDAGMD